MPVAPTYPGVYIEELPSEVRTITGVGTSTAAFVGRALRGPVDTPVVITSYEDFERVFGGLWIESTMSYAVRSFYVNGGGRAIVVRVHNGAVRTTIDAGGLSLRAKAPGAWGERLRVRIEHLPAPDTEHYNLRIRDTGTGSEESFLNVSAVATSPRSVDKVLAQSALVELSGAAPAGRPTENAAAEVGVDPLGDSAPEGSYVEANADGDDGSALTDAQLQGERNAKTGIYALLRLENEIFNLLNLPPISRETDVGGAALTEALALCIEKRALLLIDAPRAWSSVQQAVDGMTSFALSGDAGRNAAIYFPRLRMPDPLQENRLADFAPGGAIAGICARIDQQRGVWKAPAGLDASLAGVPELSIRLTDAENGRLNPLGLNCLRTFPVTGRVVWGARTLRGADHLASEWKYVPVRRLALFLEESIYRGTQWVVFEPNDEPLWAQIRLNIGAFLQNLFRQGAFQGRTPKEAYFVKCDETTTTQNDIDLGTVNIVVGFAPLKPAEFVILKIQQRAGQIAT